MYGQANENLYRKRKKIDFTLDESMETSDEDWDIAKEAPALFFTRPRIVGAKKRVKKSAGADSESSAVADESAAESVAVPAAAEPVAGTSGAVLALVAAERRAKAAERLRAKAPERPKAKNRLGSSSEWTGGRTDLPKLRPPISFITATATAT